jgi:hypothetical protein
MERCDFADHPDLAHTLHALVGELRAQGKLAEAETVALDALDLGRTRLGNERSNVAHSLHTLASVRRDQGRLVEAEASAREALALRRRLLGNEHRDVDESLVNLARVLHEQGRFLEAEAVQREELALEKKLSGEEHPLVANSLEVLANLLREQDKLVEAFNTRAMLGRALPGQKRYADAEPLLLSGDDGMAQRKDTIPALGRLRSKETLQSLVELYEATDQPDKAAQWKAKPAGFDQTEAEQKPSTAPP